MNKKEAMAIAKESADILGRDKTDNVCTGYYVLKQLVIDEEEDIVIDVVADIIKYVDPNDQHLYYGVHNFAEISGGDSICDPEFDYTKHFRQTELANLLIDLTETTFTDEELKKMYEKAVGPVDITLTEDNNDYYEIVLLEKPGEAGLTLKEVMDLHDKLSRPEGYPFEIGDINGNSTAMGFITPQAAEELEFEYGQDSELGVFISSILGDMEKESEDGTYVFKDLRIWLNR